MNRREIMEDCPEAFESKLKEVVDYFEGKLVEIRDLLDIADITQLNHIEDAYTMVKDAAEDLY